LDGPLSGLRANQPDRPSLYEELLHFALGLVKFTTGPGAEIRRGLSASARPRLAYSHSAPFFQGSEVSDSPLTQGVSMCVIENSVVSTGRQVPLGSNEDDQVLGRNVGERFM